MSAGIGTKCESPKKHWSDYSEDELREYLLKNIKKTDCSFVLEGHAIGARKVHESFKWILCDMSPVLKEILNDPENQAKNCKEIVVSNSKYLGEILHYGHTKTVHSDLVNLYDASKQYQVQVLQDDIMERLESKKDERNVNWVRLFWLTYVKYPEDQQMRAVFEKVTGKDGSMLCPEFAEQNINLILQLDGKYFDILLDIMVERRVTPRFKLTELYLIEHMFAGEKKKSIDELGPIERDIVLSYVDKLQLSGLNLMHHEFEALSSAKLFHISSQVQNIIRNYESELNWEKWSAILRHAAWESDFSF